MTKKHIEMDPFSWGMLYNKFHPAHPHDGRRVLPVRVSLDKAKNIIEHNTIIEKEPVSGLYHRTIDNQDSYETLHDAMNFSFSVSSIGMHTILWPCGQALVTAIKEKVIHEDYLKNKRVLGVSSGSGLTEIYIAKNCGPDIVVASDHDIFACAMCHLNAELNDVVVGRDLIISNQDLPDLEYREDSDLTYRLYDTVLASDFRYGVGGSQSQETYSQEILGHLRYASSGADVFISEVEYANLNQSLNPVIAEKHQRWAKEDNVSAQTVIKQYSLPFVARAIKFGLEPRHEETMLPYMPIQIHHWPSDQPRLRFQRHQQELLVVPSPPMLGNRWWDRPPSV
ncbi:MAG: hypothetical protein PHD48_01795 [Alphaproteobacteria bacterium]|nr:hypothetical protein [Alphaproteobacteria bacterium]